MHFIWYRACFGYYIALLFTNKTIGANVERMIGAQAMNNKIEKQHVSAINKNR